MKIRTSMIVIGFLAAAVVGGRAFVKWAVSPALYAGDRVEERTCPGCGGKGCAVCAGAGKVEVIVPGPTRPVRIHGDVFEGKVRHPSGKGWRIKWIRTPRTLAGTPMPGFVAGARVKITGGGATRELVTDQDGRFFAEIVPGRYRLAVAAPGFAPFEEEIEASFGGDIWVKDPPSDYPNPRDPGSTRISHGSGSMDLWVSLTRI